MYKTATSRPTPQSRSATTDCCADADCGAGLRNNYFDGKKLTPDTFRLQHSYLEERRRLLNRAIHGWGIVYGYRMAVVPPEAEQRGRVARQLVIGAGLALDRCGRELVELGAGRIDLADVIVIDAKGRRVDDRARAFDEAERSHHGKEGDSTARCWQLSVHYAEQDRDPVTVVDPCRCEQHEWDHVCETVRYTLTAIRCDDCCRHDDCELTCRCTSGECCRAEPGKYGDKGAEEAHWREEVLPGRGGCGCLCDHLTNLGPGGDCETRLCEIKESCGTVRVDLRNGVPLACVDITRDNCDEWTFGSEVEACGPRRLVKRNDLLFDLIRGCDLTRIIEIGWKDWHRKREPVPFEAFNSAFGKGDHQPEYTTRDFWVKFSRPVRRETVRPDCFVMTVMSGEQEGGWWHSVRVPIVGVAFDVAKSEDGDPADHVRGARILVDGLWLEDAVRGTRTMFQQGETRVEIEVRGDFIIDCNGQPVDANAVGLSAVRTGNGSPGGTFISGFRVDQAPDPRDRGDRYDTKDRIQGVAP
jgi:hypothetical protein